MDYNLLKLILLSVINNPQSIIKFLDFKRKDSSIFKFIKSAYNKFYVNYKFIR